MEKIKRHFHHNIARIIELKSKPIFQQFSWYFLNTTITQIFAFLSVLIVYRYLGPVNIGLMSFVSNFILGLFFVGTAIDTFVYWNLLKYDEKGQIQLLVKVFYHKLRILSFISIIALIFAYIYLPIDLFYLIITATIPTLIQGLFLSSSYLVLHKKAKLISITAMSMAAFFFICKLLAVYYKLSLIYFVLIQFIDFGFIIFFYYMISRKILHWRDFMGDIPSIKETIRFLFSLKNVILYIFTSYLLWRVDQLILSTMGNAYRLGIYAGAVKIVELSNIFLSVLTITVIPYIANNYRNYNVNNINIGFTENKREKNLLFIFILSAIVMTLFIVLFAPFIIKLLFGNKFIESTPILFWYAWTILPGFVMTYYMNIYAAKDKYREMSIIFIISIVINAGLIYILFPIYGIIGICLATIIGYSVAGLMLWKWNK